MKFRTLLNPALLAAGLMLGMTTTVEADSGRISIIHRDNDNTYDFGYRYGDYGYYGDRHHRRHHYGHHDRRHHYGHHDRGHHYGHHDRGHHYGQHKKKHWNHGHGGYKQHRRHSGHNDGYKTHSKGHHGKYRDDRSDNRRHRS